MSVFLEEETHTQRTMPDEDTPRDRMAMWQQKQRLGWRGCKPRNTKDHRPQPKLSRGKGGFDPGSRGQHGPAGTLISDFQPLELGENELGIYSHSTVLSPKGRTSKYHIWDLECQHRNFEGTLTFNVGMPVYVWISIDKVYKMYLTCFYIKKYSTN